ncbi:MAG: hypothetical protein JO142_13955 [Burkholderiales bacterium]|nr:hypothetical protein [Burkholderiales bacterium]
MNPILRKTEAGQQALQAREGGVKLPVRLRTLLLQVDGQKRQEQLVQLAVSLGSPADLVDKLLEMGLVEGIAGTEIVEAPPIVETPAAPVVTQVVANESVAESDAGRDIPVSSKLPEHLQPVATQMREIADAHLGLTALLLKRRISHCDTELELRQALIALKEALTKATNADRATELLTDIAAALPVIGMNRAQTYKG